uniref:Putative mpv17/PMP22 n=1 Tax=Helianthus annuus TaxID=4232 RepID=A0A251RLZ6_HELAN
MDYTERFGGGSDDNEGLCVGLRICCLKLVCLEYLNQAIIVGVLSAISDIVSQKLSGIQKLQIRRLLLKVLFGFSYLGPFGHYYHILLDKLFKGKKDSTTVAKKGDSERFGLGWNDRVLGS